MAEPAVRVLLASASPRRLDLLRRIGVEPVVRPAQIDETPRPGEAPDAYVLRMATSKEAAVDGADDWLVIAADTVVVFDGSILGKPDSADDARRTLRRLSGNTHDVLTGFALRFEGRRAVAVEATTVQFRELLDAEIDAYVATGDPLDKAGSYALQGRAGAFVTGIDGSDSNVIGLPLARLVEEARRIGADLLTGRDLTPST